jgi:lipopolysaccharide export system permease protein
MNLSTFKAQTPIFDRYLASNLVSATLTVLFVLLAIFSFFAFIEEMEEIGKGNYTISTAIFVVLLKIPGLVYQLLPISALIGCLLGLGSMTERGELAVVRCAGVSKAGVLKSVSKVGLYLVLATAFVGDFVYPQAEQRAESLRNLALDGKPHKAGVRGFWAMDRGSYVNIATVLPEEIRDIRIFKFDKELNLQTALFAKRGYFQGDSWKLHDIEKTIFSEGQIITSSNDIETWESTLAPDLIAMSAIEPDSLTTAALFRYIRFAKDNGLDSRLWETGLWSKIGGPLATGTMVFLTRPLVLGTMSQRVSSGRRVLFGSFVGLGFYMFNQTASHVGVVLEVPSYVTALGPTGLLALCGVILFSRVS